MESAEGIRNLLLKIVIPLAFPLAGSFICDLITNRPNSHSYTDSYDSSIQLNPSYGSTWEEEEEEMDSLHGASRKLAQSENACSNAGRLLMSEFSRQASTVEEITVAQATEAPSEAPSQVSSNKLQQGDQRIVVDELASLKRMVLALEERTSSIESQFHDYCDMKEQESAYQKMQIMCLGMKLELLDSHNQRLEAAATEIRTVAQEFAAMRGKLERLQNRLKKISRRRQQDSAAVNERILALDAKQAEMATRCEEFEQCMEEMKRLTLQLQEQRGANNENVEVVVERSLRKLSSGRDLVDGLEALRDRWAAGVEEMIYLAWITAWLQHDLLLCDAGGTVIVGDGSDDDDGNVERHPPPEEEKAKGETRVAPAAPSNEVQLCKAPSTSSSSGASSDEARRSMEAARPSCMGSACRDGAGWSIGRPRLLRKLRGWAGGKGRCKRPCRIVGPCCQK
ncbi:hypothetical protein ACP70R_014747 [Stipagrostis hirtigluma subsp. patula]